MNINEEVMILLSNGLGAGELTNFCRTAVDELIGSRHGLLHCILLAGLFVVSVYPQKPNESKVIDHSSALQMSDSQSLIVLERGRCYGTCPAYRVTIFSDGGLVYEGFDFVKVKGRVEVSISKEQVRELRDAVERAKYFSLQDSYGFSYDGCTSRGSDSPTVVTTVRIGDRTKSVNHYLGCIDGSSKYTAEMKRLTTFEVKIDDIIDIEQWIGTEEERRKFEFLKKIN